MTSSAPTPAAPSAPRPGLFARVRTLLAGSRDPIDAQLAEIERQGANLARLAHAAAGCLIILFSIGSLLGLSHDALLALEQQWRTTHTVDLPSALAAAVNAILVVVMDTALLHGASMLRIIKARQGEGAGVHVLVMTGVSVIEGATWAYFSWLYDRPHDPVAWALIGARAVAAPLLSAYLSLARAIPIGPRDILYQAAMASGKGVIRDVTREANDQSAPLARKMAIYGAAALMHPTDRTRLDHMIAAVTVRQDAHLQGHAQTLGISTAYAGAASPTDHPSYSSSLPAPAPSSLPAPAPASAPIARAASPVVSVTAAPNPITAKHAPGARSARPQPRVGEGLAGPGPKRLERPSPEHRVVALSLAPARSRPLQGKQAPTREELRRRRLTAAQRILAANPTIGVRELTRQIAMATRYRISESTASALREQIRAANASANPERQPASDDTAMAE